jgi:hypothetical protein
MGMVIDEEDFDYYRSAESSKKQVKVKALRDSPVF